MYHLENVKHIFHGLVFLIVTVKLYLIEREISLLEKTFVNK